MTFEERAEFLFQSIESHNQQIGENAFQIGRLKERLDQLGDKIDRVVDSIEKLVIVTNEDATSIRTLARIAEAHESRISSTEENL